MQHLLYDARRTNPRLTGISEKSVTFFWLKKKRTHTKNIFTEIENFSNMGKEINMYISETCRISNNHGGKRTSP